MKPREKQKLRTRGRILAAARKLFEKHGFKQTTLREIASRVGITAGTIFVHFPDKVALLVATLEDVVGKELEKALARFPENADIRTQLLYIARHFFSFYARDPRLIRTLLRETHLLTVDYVAPIHAQLAEHLEFFARRFEVAKERGEVAGDTVSITAASAFFAYYHMALIDLLTHEPTNVEPPLFLLSTLLDQLLAGIGPRGAS